MRIAEIDQIGIQLAICMHCQYKSVVIKEPMVIFTSSTNSVGHRHLKGEELDFKFSCERCVKLHYKISYNKNSPTLVKVLRRAFYRTFR